MADDSIEVHEELDFHSCNVPYGMVPFIFDDLTHDQKSELNKQKVETIRNDEIYLARHPQVRAIINIILRRVFRVRPKKDIRTFIGRYFLRSYEDIKAEVGEVMRPRKDRVHEGDSAVRISRQTIRTKKEKRSKEVAGKGMDDTKAEPEDPETIVKAIIDEILDHLERVCTMEMKVIFSDDEDDFLSDFNYRVAESIVPIGRSISEEVFRIEQEEQLARERMQRLEEIPDEDAIRRYIEQQEYYGQGEYYGETLYRGDLGELVGYAGVARELSYEPLWKSREDVYGQVDDSYRRISSSSRDGTATEDRQLSSEERDFTKEREIDEVDYDDEIIPLDDDIADEERVDETAAYETGAAMYPDGEGPQSRDGVVAEIPDEEELQEVPYEEEAVQQLPEHPVTSAPQVVKDAAAQEKDMEEYFLAPIEDTVPTYLQADDDQEDWSPIGPEVKGAAMAKVVPGTRKGSQGVVRSYSITTADAKGSRVQLVIDRGEVHDHKPQAWDFASDKGHSSKTKLTQTHSSSKTKLLTSHEKNKSVTLVRTSSRHDKTRNDPKQFD